MRTAVIGILLYAVLLLLPAVTAAQSSCNSWLNVNEAGSGVRIGDLDITGNQLTVEAKFVRTAPYAGPYVFAGDIVSKHFDPTDVNYLLRPGSAEITTSNGYFITPEVCAFKLNQTYHVAMVYDGITLKFYRNGFLMSQVAASGQLVNNDYSTTIGQNARNLFISPEEYLNGFIDEVRIWDRARTQQDIRANMDNSLASPATQVGLKAYYRFNSLVNLQGNTTWNGTLTGNAAINKVNPYCNFTADSCFVSCNSKVDFTFEQDLCKPSQFRFQTSSDGIKTIEWDFGSLGTNTTQFSPVIDFPVYNVPYTVRLTVTGIDGCTSVISKEITPELDFASNPNGDFDTTICIGQTVQLSAPSSWAYCWSPAPNIYNTGIQSPVVDPVVSTTYFFNRFEPGPNLVTNGDFTDGTIGFISDYQVAATGYAAGSIKAGTDPQLWNATLDGCIGDGTNDYMLMVKGHNADNKRVWVQQVAVQPNTNYVFRFNLQALSSDNPARLQVYFNGLVVGKPIQLTRIPCKPEAYTVYWNSGSATSLELSIINQVTAQMGNSFALDDLVLAPYRIVRDSARVSVSPSPLVVAGADTTICSGAELWLRAVTAAENTLKWTPAGIIADPSSNQTPARPLQTTRFAVTVMNASGCSSTDSVLVTVRDMPQFNVSPMDSSICEGSALQLKAAGANIYEWYQDDQLIGHSGELQVNPNASTLYRIYMRDSVCGKSDTYSIPVTVYPAPELTLEKSNDIDCLVTEARISVGGAANFRWRPHNSILEEKNATIWVAPSQTFTYVVTGTDTNGCAAMDSMEIKVNDSNKDKAFLLANAFSPNNDGKNDCFGTTHWGKLDGYRLVIWNRYGQQVYTTGTQSHCWDGTTNGRLQPEGTYIYQVVGSSHCGAVNKKGILLLVR